MSPALWSVTLFVPVQWDGHEFEARVTVSHDAGTGDNTYEIHEVSNKADESDVLDLEALDEDRFSALVDKVHEAYEEGFLRLDEESERGQDG